MFNTFTRAWQEFLPALPAYYPLGVIGGWRWGVWLTKKIVAQFYRPTTGLYQATVSVVTPVYNENPAIFSRALASWRLSGVEEIIAVIDYTDEECIRTFRTFQRNFSGAKLIVTQEPGKRPALAIGAQAATGEIIALVDSDTVWEHDVRAICLRPFCDPEVGGVTMRQVVTNPITLSQHLFQIQQNIRFLDEYPFLTAWDGSTVHCLSGRTAFYRRNALLPVLPDLVNEHFWGQPVISGDDKRLTYLIQQRGWKTAYQRNAQVYTRGEPDMITFLKQRLRWARNSWRADLLVLSQSWTWHKPYFVIYLVDRMLQPFTLLMGPIYLIWSLIFGLWLPAITLIIWWHLSRVVRLWSHLKRAPFDIYFIPAYVWFNFLSSLIRIYALVTLTRQGWITRWHSHRLPQLRWLSAFSSLFICALIIAAMFGLVFLYKNEDIQTTRLRNDLSVTKKITEVNNKVARDLLPMPIN